MDIENTFTEKAVEAAHTALVEAMEKDKANGINTSFTLLSLVRNPEDPTKSRGNTAMGATIEGFVNMVDNAMDSLIEQTQKTEPKEACNTAMAFGSFCLSKAKDLRRTIIKNKLGMSSDLEDLFEMFKDLKGLGDMLKEHMEAKDKEEPKEDKK